MESKLYNLPIANILPSVEVESEQTQIWRDRINSLSPSFSKALEDIKTMTDTFGICGLVCYHIMGHLTIPDKWRDIIFDPIKSKSEFDEFERAQTDGKPTGTTPAFKFLEANSDKFTRVLEKARTKEKVVEFLNNIDNNQRMFFAVVCSYPKHEGQYTHWITS